LNKRIARTPNRLHSVN